MKILILSPHPERLIPILTSTGDEIVPTYADADLAVSYNHPTIVRPTDLSKCPHINMHISYLPWNRGADPNFWSWFDDTPKGVSIHYMDEHLDTGPLLARARVEFDTGVVPTLRSTYAILQTQLVELFRRSWPVIRTLPSGRFQAATTMPTHRRADAAPLLAQLPLGWDTPVAVVRDFGRAYREASGLFSQVGSDASAGP